jgi:BNR repeat protein
LGRPLRFKLISGLLGTAVAVTVGSTGAWAASATVSSYPSPYDTPGCLAIDNYQTSHVSGIDNYLNAEVEPQVAVDPTDSDHQIGVWQQDRWTDGGNNGEVSAYTTGAGWTDVPQPFSACYHASGFSGAYANYQRSSDPWVSIGPGQPGSVSSCSPTTADCSTAYSVSLSFDETDNRTAVYAATSYDGGASWTNLTPLIQDPCPGLTPRGYSCNPKSFVLNDKESVTADPTKPGYAYTVWDRLQAPPASGPGFFHELAFMGPAFISRTTDYGQTWSRPQQIVTTPSIDQTIGNVIVVDPTTGTLYDFFTYIQNFSNRSGHRGLTIQFVKSTDHGITWGSPQFVASEPVAGVSDPNNLDPSTNTAPASLRTGAILAEPTVSATGQLYVTWEGFDPGSGTDQAFITTSTTGGSTWSAPSLVNRGHTSAPAYTPSIAVTSGGTVYVSYYQWDAATSSGLEPTRLFVQKSASAGSSTAPPTFGSPSAISSEFNGLAAAWAGGYFLGDYEGLGATSSGFVAFNVLTNCDDSPPHCAALSSVVNPTSLTPTDKRATDVVAITGS